MTEKTYQQDLPLQGQEKWPSGHLCIEEVALNDVPGCPSVNYERHSMNRFVMLANE